MAQEVIESAGDREPLRTTSPSSNASKTGRVQRRYLRPKGLAKLHLDATIEDLNFKAVRSLDRSLILRLASAQ